MLVLNLADAKQQSGQLKHWSYNALDVTGTREIADNLLPELKGPVADTYAFERALQAPAMSMMMRGVRVNDYLRNEMVKELKQELRKDDKAIAALVADKWDGTELETGICPANFGQRHKWPRGVPDAERVCERCGTPRVHPAAFNANSPDQVGHLLHDLHGVPELSNKKGIDSDDKDVLKRLAQKHPQVKPFIDAILAIRDKKKQLGSLLARLSPNGRYHSSFNVGAAWTGRFSSSRNPFGWGGNLQNVAPRHRRVFIADPGTDIGYADYMQGESNLVAHLSGDEKYIEAHRLGDVHTYVTRYVWPELPWTGDLARDKKIAKQNPPWDEAEGHDYRFQCKRIQHGSNYGLTPFGISMIAQIPLAQAKAAYANYMTEFDGIPAWQDWVRGEVQNKRPLVNPLGRTVTLFGRPWDKHTWRQALAFLPQSALADIDDIALWRVWYDLETKGVYLLAQVHDALLHLFPTGRVDLEREVLARMAIPVPVTDFRGTMRVMTIGVETATGSNWGHHSEANPRGINEEPMASYMKDHPLV
jgi:DNA polymerase I-like protein with 3'-5' exonuclease and polymerase domains